MRSWLGRLPGLTLVQRVSTFGQASDSFGHTTTIHTAAMIPSVAGYRDSQQPPTSAPYPSQPRPQAAATAQRASPCHRGGIQCLLGHFHLQATGSTRLLLQVQPLPSADVQPQPRRSPCSKVEAVAELVALVLQREAVPANGTLGEVVRRSPAIQRVLGEG